MRPDALVHSARLAELLAREHAVAADFLLSLADFDVRELHRDLGHASLFDYLHRELGLSRGAAHYRKVAARLVRAHPAVVQPLRDGRLCITSVVELARVLTPANEAAVLPRFFHRSRREARAMAVELSPAPVLPKRTVVTTARPAQSAAGPVQPVERDLATSGVRAAAPPSAARTTLPGEPPADPGPPSPSFSPSASDLPGPPALTLDAAPSWAPAFPPEYAPSAAAAAAHRLPRLDDVTPLSADRSRLHVTVSRRFLDKLEAARAARSHARPGATVEDLLEEGLDLLLAREARRREAALTRRAPRDATAARAKDRHRAANGVAGASPAADQAARASQSGSGVTAPKATRERSLAPEPVAHVVTSAARTGSGAATTGSAVEASSASARPAAGAPHSDRVPAAARREVWARDGGRCQWPLARGGICGATHRVELDHVVPRALGGPSTPDNLRLLCQAHNLEAARRALGALVVDRYAASRRLDAASGVRRKVRGAGRVDALHGTRDSPSDSPAV